MTLRTLAVALLLCSARSDDSAATVDSTDANIDTESAEDELAWDEMDSDLAWDDIDEVEADPATVRALFERLDASGDGRLDVAELQAALESQARSYFESVRASTTDETHALLGAADADDDGTLSLPEFEAGRLYVHHADQVERPDLFAFADVDADGQVAPSELHALLFPEWSGRADAFRAFLRERVRAAHDADADGRLTRRELYGWRQRLRGEDTAEDEGGDEDEGLAAEDAQRFEWHDGDGDGALDEDELGEFLLPRSTADGGGETLQELTREELRRLVAALQLGMLPEQAGRFGEGMERDDPNVQGEDHFGVEQALALGAPFLRSFQLLLEEDEEPP